ncbi:hypothetical protein [Prosthecochloris sp.]|uniref:hypothetical protein n=1 Tax=Prosthecochloris sp. TaxID=290513 RepID=UPI0025E748FB|nr:hypothetical protein [Prosthecochloris sp.]
MPLTCGCGDYEDYDEVFYGPDEYSVMPQRRRRARCASCKSLINEGDTVTVFSRSRRPRNDVESRICGDDLSYDIYAVPLASLYLCESCSDLFFSLDALGFCVGPYEDLRETVKQYHREYGPGKVALRQ